MQVSQLWRYPVKSMQGDELNASHVNDRGLLGDRALALMDPETGKVVSAKNPRKWPELFNFRAMFTAPPEPDVAPAVEPPFGPRVVDGPPPEPVVELPPLPPRLVPPPDADCESDAGMQPIISTDAMARIP